MCANIPTLYTCTDVLAKTIQKNIMKLISCMKKKNNNNKHLQLYIVYVFNTRLLRRKIPTKIEKKRDQQRQANKIQISRSKQKQNLTLDLKVHISLLQ